MIGVVHAALPQIAADVEAARARQHDVEQDHVEALARRALESPIGRPSADATVVALAFEAIGQRQHQARLVFDEQHALAGEAAGADADWRRRPASR